jgi:6-phosphogluconate dehydrogenase
MKQAEIGVVGLGVMGKNLALNLAEHGVRVAVFDAWPEQLESFAAESAGTDIVRCGTLDEMVRSLAVPRAVLLLVKAGEVTEATISSTAQLLDTGDLIIDGGNEHFSRTERRAQDLRARGLGFMGLGVSGGAAGARRGPALMPGGEREHYDRIASILERVAARSEQGLCVTYVGRGGAGHYVKMVHNGIEYADMQLIAEAYGALTLLGGLSNSAAADVFARFTRGELASYLVEITAKILRQRDDRSAGDLIDAIADQASMKGTGVWVVEEALALGVPLGTIAAAVEGRQLSARRAERARFATLLPGPVPTRSGHTPDDLEQIVESALLTGRYCAYAQGLHLVRAARERGYDVDLAELARIWTAGCIIRARLLASVSRAFARNPALDHLFVDADVAEALGRHQLALRTLVQLAQSRGMPVPAMSAALSYYDGYRAARSTANLIEAQRDYFGAHGYGRLDAEGRFHSEWATGASE